MSMNNSSRAHSTKRRPTLKISFDEEPALSESDNEDEIYPTALHVNFPLKKKVGVKKTVQCKSVQCNIEPNNSTKLMTDQDLILPCGHCKCCKKMSEFLKPITMTEPLTQPSSSADYDTGQGPSGIQDWTKGKNIVNEQGNSSPKVNIISCKTLRPLTKSKKVDYLDKYCKFDAPNIAENESETLTNESCNKTESSLDLSNTEMASGQYYDVSNTAAGCEKTQDEMHKTNILPSAQSKIIPQQLDNSVDGQKIEKIKQKSRILLSSGKGRQPQKSINTYAHSSTDQLELSTATGKKNDTKLNIINEKLKYKSKLITHTQDTTDFQLNGKGAKAKIGNFRSSSSPDLHKENKSYNDVLDNESLMSTGKKQINIPRKTITNKAMNDLSSDNQMEQEDIFAMPTMKRPKKSALDFSISQNQSLLNENISKEENVLEPMKKRQKGRPKKLMLQCASNDNEKQLGSSAGRDYSSLNQSNGNIIPAKGCKLRRSLRTPKPVISFLAETDPYSLKYKIRRKKRPKRRKTEKLVNRLVRTPLLNIPLDTTSNDSYKKARRNSWHCF